MNMEYNRRHGWRSFVCIVSLFCSFGQAAIGATPQTHDEKPMELSGFSPSQAYEIEDGKQLVITDPMLQQLVFRISQTSNKTLAKYTNYSADVSWPQVMDSVSDFRLFVFDRGGRVQRVQSYKFPNAERDDPVRGCFVADCVSNDGQPFRVVTLSNPGDWKVGMPLNEPIRFKGFLYALVDGSLPPTLAFNDQDERADDPSDESLIGAVADGDGIESGSKESGSKGFELRNLVPTFIAIRLAWFPHTVNQELNIGESHVLLAEHGVDAGQFEFVRHQHNRPLSSKDSESFFQVLKAVKNISAEELESKIGKSKIGFSTLMRESKQSFGKSVAFRGRVRTCTPILSSDIVQQIGQQKYYQLVMFPDLDGQEISVQDSSGEKLVYNRFPVTVCTLGLPNGMSPQDMEKRSVFIDGFYFRFWKYQSELTDEKGATGQVSPIIIANQPVLVESNEAILNWIMGAFASSLVLGLAFLIWYFRSASQQRKELVGANLPDQIDLTGIDG